ncbi:polyphosphate kinase 1 [Clostridium aminobutyricum]|uniref:polyphosphate kinase 1 n=1 Tax=Clostridium aminobutyricum TaxID=33953 RepID=UPI0031455B16
MTAVIANNRRYTQNRELSWLKFNERVLEEAADSSVPLMERLKFVSIFTSNLDEFFMIRVGSLFDLSVVDEEHRDNKSGMTAKEQLEKIYIAVRTLYEQKSKVYKEIKTGLQEYGVSPLDFYELETVEVKYIKEYYKANIKPILSPQIVDPHHPFPHIANKEIYIIALLKHRNDNILGLLPVPHTLPEIIFFPSSDVRYIRTEKVLLEFASDAFGKHEIVEKNCLCVTRNADINPDSETFEAIEDFRSFMKKFLHKRKKLSVIRLEANYSMSEKFSNYLCEKFDIESRQIFISDTPLKMEYVFGLFSKLSVLQTKQLTYPAFTSAQSASLTFQQSMIKQIKQKDVMLFYPFENMDAFLHLIKEAANDPNTIAIKISIYRLAKKAKLVDYLCAAAENGKEVTVLMELRARFDEQNNIDWSEKLEEFGCKIIYGLDAYKVHSKVCLIMLKEKSGVSYITQVGTGNYNEKTAELYTDLSLITANPDIGRDAAEFFKNMSIGHIDGNYEQLLVAPTNFKSSLLAMIDEEIGKGEHGSIIIKINSLTDIDMIDRLTEASKAGVNIKLIVRGICCLLPKINGETDNITIISIVGRFLEHSRIYSFGKGDQQQIYISSADLMTRNTERRIEVACPVLDKYIKYQINTILEAIWYDNVKARILFNDGNYIKKIDNRASIDCQVYFEQVYSERAAKVSAVKKGFWHKFSSFVSKLRITL